MDRVPHSHHAPVVKALTKRRVIGSEARIGGVDPSRDGHFRRPATGPFRSSTCVEFRHSTKGTCSALACAWNSR